MVSLMFAKTVQMYSTPNLNDSGGIDVISIANSTLRQALSGQVDADVLSSSQVQPISSLLMNASSSYFAYDHSENAVVYTPIQVASAIALLVGLLQVRLSVVDMKTSFCERKLQTSVIQKKI